LTFDNKEYKIKDVRSNGFFVINYGGSECYNFINPKYIYQTSNEQAETKSENVAKIKQHIQDEIDEAQAEKEEQTL
jgi:hypothetical protein